MVATTWIRGTQGASAAWRLLGGVEQMAQDLIMLLRTTYELFISGTFHLIFSERGWPWVTKTTESETAHKEGQLRKRISGNMAACLQILKCFYVQKGPNLLSIGGQNQDHWFVCFLIACFWKINISSIIPNMKCAKNKTKQKSEVQKV